jgi:hypothetical protein
MPVGFFMWIFKVLYSSLLHLLPLRIHPQCRRILGSNPAELKGRDDIPLLGGRQKKDSFNYSLIRIYLSM